MSERGTKRARQESPSQENRNANSSDENQTDRPKKKGRTSTEAPSPKQVKNPSPAAQDDGTTVPRRRFKTSTDAIDLELLDGGVEEGTLLHVFGEAGAGKTQMALTATARALLAEPKKKVVFIDSSNTFRPSRLGEILAARGAGPKEVKDAQDRCLCAQARGMERMSALLRSLKGQAKGSLSLCVVDSIGAAFRRGDDGKAATAKGGPSKRSVGLLPW